MDNVAKEWLRRARSSLALSRKRDDANIALEDLCFQAQQASEKALKAYLAYSGQNIPRTHDLIVLLKAVEKTSVLPEEILQIVILNDYSVQTRYPGDYSPIDNDEYDAAIKAASTCVEWIEKLIR